MANVLAAVVGPLLVAAGAALTVVGSFLHWATLAIASDQPDGGDFSSSLTLQISYDGMQLVEARAALVLGVLALLLAGIGLGLAARGRAGAAAPRWWAATLLAAGCGVVVVSLFSIAAHPATVATLLQSSGNFRGSTVTVDTGVGVWLALVGGVVVALAAGAIGWGRSLLSRRGADPDDSEPLDLSADTVG